MNSVRIDKWLWAARFFKSRSLAQTAVSGGKVHCNGQRIKPSRLVVVGDIVRIQKGLFEFNITVLGLSEKRGPAREAVLLYEESKDSVEQRTKVKEERRFLRMGMEQFGPIKKPGKRDRRLIRNFTRRESS